MNSDTGFETLQVSVDGPIGQLWLNRPERLNALSTQLLKEVADAARWFDAQDKVRVVMVGGRGRAFSGGADLTGFPSLENPKLRDCSAPTISRQSASWFATILASVSGY